VGLFPAWLVYERGDSMKTYIYGIAIVLWAVTCVLALLYVPRTNHKRIDCSVAEFHPDYTIEMKEQCRMVRSGRLL
jgi:hypothetical protein